MLHEEIIHNDPDKKIPLREIMSIFDNNLKALP
jgi:hypothetical protein